ncbi:aminotransferase class IV [Nocardiopsis changdeensis]|uniref:Aminotransferase class IV family protein n=1 Tax=Nocardiopsis changdeensis TaxID=2831969 RepID=A0ABX8BT04_9ACTN|nr:MULTISPECIES: aminotransferase class IV [Nocardiopsis]QUX24359.1 aminotransferase class IV family protein [Nocardiopsis changdeensis]QYX34750.1 aminotransferase class IV [Nocardiopsis sp. MT53]
MRVWIAGAGYGRGTVVDAAEARIPVADHGITVGDGVFETVRARQGRTFALTRHLRRLARSAEGLGMETPDLDLVASGVEQAVAANPELSDARVRITVTDGAGPLGSDRSVGEQTMIVALGPFPPIPPHTNVALAPWPRNEFGALAGLKTTSYADNVRALAYAKARGASEAVFRNISGNLCEGTGSNIFVVLDGRLVTPPLSAGPLAGITRELVLEWYGGEEEDVPMERLPEIGEAFLTSTGRDVQPVLGIGDLEVSQAPGPVTLEAMKVFAERAAADLDP